MSFIESLTHINNSYLLIPPRQVPLCWSYCGFLVYDSKIFDHDS